MHQSSKVEKVNPKADFSLASNEVVSFIETKLETW